jgi:chaperonin cofactor prefoldin
MKGPAEGMRKLTKEQLRQVQEIEERAEEALRTRDEVEYDINETRATISEDVWKELVRRANEAGWPAMMNGAVVRIRRP